MNAANFRLSLHQRMGLVAEQILLDFKQSASVVHRGSKGTVREGDLRRSFLEKYVSGSARVIGSGELVAADGQVSPQCDVMIVEPDTPPLWRSDDYAVVPVECCHVVIEVKSNLTVEELRKSWAAAKKAKSLPRSSYLPSSHPLLNYTRTVHGREWPHAVPLRHMVFGYEGATLDALGQEFSVLATEDNDPTIGIDAAFVLGRGIVSWHTLATDQIFQRMPNSVVFTSKAQPGNVLLFMLTSINDIVSAARLNERFNLKGYITQAFGQIDSWWLAGTLIRHPATREINSDDSLGCPGLA